MAKMINKLKLKKKKKSITIKFDLSKQTIVSEFLTACPHTFGPEPN